MISLYLDSNLSKQEDANAVGLLRGDMENFYARMTSLNTAVSETLSKELEQLRRISGAETPSQLQDMKPARRNRTQDALSTHLQSRLHNLRTTQQTHLPARRRELTATASSVLSARGDLLERIVTVLERTKHGARARGAKARAEHLGSVAMGLEGKLRYVCLVRSFALHAMRCDLFRDADTIG